MCGGTPMHDPIRKFFTRILLHSMLMLVILWGVGFNANLVAMAEIRQLEEAPGQRVYQSRQTLQDQHGNRWQAIAFKRIRPDGQTSFYLRLVGFPQIVEIDRTQPLTLTTSLGKMWTATEASSDLFTEAAKPEPYISQYDIQPLLPQLQTEIPMKLLLPTTKGEFVRLLVPPSFVREWQTIANS